MFSNQVQPQTRVPNFGLAEADHTFLTGAVQQHAGDIRDMLPDAFATIKFAAAVVGILAIGCAVAAPQARGRQAMFGQN